MKIQFLNGGLANQAFQYIFARYYELSHKDGVMYMDDTYFALNTVHNGYELEKVFGIKPHMLSECFDQSVWAFILEEKKKGKSVPQILCENQIETQMLSEVGEGHQTFNPFTGKVFSIPCNQFHPEILELPGNIYYHGYWINKNWFAAYQQNFLQEFCFPEITDSTNLQYRQLIQSVHSLSVHIRRGDYVSLNWAWEPEKYRACIEQFVQRTQEKWHLFVFSDDIDWCRENARKLGFESCAEVTYIEGNVQGRNYLDMQLMSLCEAMILSNSAFCYLAALLNTKKQYVLNLTNREV